MARRRATASLLMVCGTLLGAAKASTPEGPAPGRRSAEAYYEFLLGKIRRFEGELDAAAEHLNKAALADDSSAVRAELAETYLRMGDLGRALEQARLAIQRDPSDVDARKTLVQAYMAQAGRGSDRKGATESAIEEIRTILKLAPAENDLRLTLCRFLIQEDRVAEALVEIRSLRASGGDPVATGLLMGRALLHENRAEEAQSELLGVLAISPRNYEALLTLSQIAQGREDWEAAARYYERLVDIRPNDNTLRSGLGYVLLRGGKSGQAVGVLREAAAQSGTDRSAREMLVRALGAARRPGEALHELEVLLTYKPADPELLIEAGRLRESREENALALEAYRRAASSAAEGAEGSDGLADAVKPHLTLAIASLEIATGDAAAALRTLQPIARDASDLGLNAAALRVRALAAAGNRDEAVKEAEAFRTAAPGDRRGGILLLEARLAGAGADGFAPALEEFRPEGRSPEEVAAAAEILRAAGKGRIALGIVEQAVAVHPQDATLSFVLGALHERLGNSRKAEVFLARAIELDPKQGRALNYLGYSLADRGKELPRAESLIRQALSLESDNGAYLDSLGWVLLKQGRLEEAEAALVRAADLLAGDGTVREHLGDLYMLKKDRQRALTEWKTAQDLRPEDPQRLRRKILEVSRAER